MSTPNDRVAIYVMGIDVVTDEDEVKEVLIPEMILDEEFITALRMHSNTYEPQTTLVDVPKSKATVLIEKGNIKIELENCSVKESGVDLMLPMPGIST